AQDPARPRLMTGVMWPFFTVSTIRRAAAFLVQRLVSSPQNKVSPDEDIVDIKLFEAASWAHNKSDEAPPHHPSGATH
ncbi:hypothetical protein PRIPAC_75460, partial [Pristionchus pacificus]|uniref:Uncharacterized protein n=1 Tax=Pristionchus pacificus TaxID=54126 RepID=A0A2A6CER9_PRIPA